MFILIASGWTIKTKELPDPDILVPIGLLILTFHIIVVGLGRITDDSYYKYTDYEGWAGWVIIILRFCLFGWFLYNWTETNKLLPKNQSKKFFENFLFLVSLYFLSLPVIAMASSYLVAPYVRHKFITGANVLVMIITMGILSYIFTSKSATYAKISTSNMPVLPGAKLDWFYNFLT